MKRTISLFLAGSMLAMATAASAANRAETFSISPVVGGITFEGKQHLKTNPVYGVRAGYNFTKALGFEGLFDYAATKPTIGGGNVDFFRYGGELLYHFIPDSTFVPYVAAGFAGGSFKGSVPLGETNKVKGVFDYGLGAKYFITDNIALRGDVRHLLYRYNDAQQHAVEYVLGLYLPFGGKSAARPVAKPVEPPPAPAPAPAPVAKPVVAPAPPPPPAAPTADLSVSPANITKGASATLKWTSKNASKCDIQPAIGSVQPEGTMSITPDDNTAYTLTCNGDGGTATSAAKIAVTVPAPVVEAAQPKASAAKLCSPTVLNVQFDTNKYNIKPQYYDELQKVGDFLKENPDAKGVIEGHTDSVGSKASNMKLSQNRAESVRNYIIKTFGIAPERIGAKGYGPTKPIADNKTKEGKQQNRRIEANFECNGK